MKSFVFNKKTFGKIESRLAINRLQASFIELF